MKSVTQERLAQCRSGATVEARSRESDNTLLTRMQSSSDYVFKTAACKRLRALAVCSDAYSIGMAQKLRVAIALFDANTACTVATTWARYKKMGKL